MTCLEQVKSQVMYNTKLLQQAVQKLDHVSQQEEIISQEETNIKLPELPVKDWAKLLELEDLLDQKKVDAPAIGGDRRLIPRFFDKTGLKSLKTSQTM